MLADDEPRDRFKDLAGTHDGTLTSWAAGDAPWLAEPAMPTRSLRIFGVGHVSKVLARSRPRRRSVTGQYDIDVRGLLATVTPRLSTVS